MDMKHIFSFREQEDESKPFMDHVGELRVMIIRMAVTLVVATVGAFFFRNYLAAVVQRPLLLLDPARANALQSLGVADSMTISLSLAFYAGMVISFPLLTLFLAQFLFPALKPGERKILFPVSAFALLLFIIGIAFGVAFEMPMVVLALVKLGFLTAAKLRKTRSVAIITIFTVAAFITPSPDLVTYLLMGGPMVVLYEFCIILAKWVEPKSEISQG